MPSDEPDDGLGDEEPLGRWLPPDDRVWRHPSEVTGSSPVAARALWSPSPRQPAPRQAGTWRVALLSGLAGSLLTTGAIAAAGGLSDDERVVKTTVEREVPVGVLDSRGAEAIAERTRPAVVRVEVDRGPKGVGTGSGVLFRSDGYLLTNSHVVEGARELRVVTSDGRRHAARRVGSDDHTDLTVLRAEGEGFPTAPLGRATDLKEGQQAVAVGISGPDAGVQVAMGVVSALGQVATRQGRSLNDMIQVDAPIPPMSSGGALIDANGTVIGISSSVKVEERTETAGLSYATPIDLARSVAEELIGTGQVVHAVMAVDLQELDPATAVSEGVDAGVRVAKVWPDGPAAKAGVAEGDILTSIGTTPVSSKLTTSLALRQHRPGDKVEVSVRRQATSRTLAVVLTRRA